MSVFTCPLVTSCRWVRVPEMVAFLSGKKTYLTALAGAVYGVLIATKVVPSEVSVWATIGSLNMASWKLALDKWFSAGKVTL